MSHYENKAFKPSQKNCCCANKAQKIAELSAEAPSKLHSHQLKILGASCGGCVNNIEQTLEAVPGVIGAQMDLKTGVANISGDVSVEHLIQSLNDLGYVAKEDNEGGEK